jgi:hypothetical protein
VSSCVFRAPSAYTALQDEIIDEQKRDQKKICNGTTESRLQLHEKRYLMVPPKMPQKHCLTYPRRAEYRHGNQRTGATLKTRLFGFEY